MNASLYPTSANAYVSLGDLWLARKDSAKALGYFEKALALRPGLQRAKDMARRAKGGT